MLMLAKNRFVSVSEFKGKAYVNIREYYDKDGKQMPGKKGKAHFKSEHLISIVINCFYNKRYRVGYCSMGKLEKAHGQNR